MNIKEIKVDYLLKQITKKDSLFKGEYTLDPYQNCAFGCTYCDSTLDDTIYIKNNALEVLDTELQLYPTGRIILGSVHDPYQPVEQGFHLTHHILQRISLTDFSVHILTKSPTVLKDRLILKKLHHPIVTFSILCLDEQIYKTFEPNAPHPKNRFKALKTLSDNNITTGIALIPLLPFFSETLIDEVITEAKRNHATYVIYKPLFLQGKQKQVFLDHLKNKKPGLYDQYKQIYASTPTPSKKVMKPLTSQIEKTCEELNIKTSIQKIIT